MLVAALRRPSPNPLLLFPSPLRAPPSSPSSASNDRSFLSRLWSSIAHHHHHQQQNALLLVRLYSSDRKDDKDPLPELDDVADKSLHNDVSSDGGKISESKLKAKKEKAQDEQSVAKATLPGLWKRFLMKPKEVKEVKENKEVKETKDLKEAKEKESTESKELNEVKEIVEVKDSKESDGAASSAAANAPEKRPDAIVPTFVRYEKVREVSDMSI